MFDASDYMITVAEMGEFADAANEKLTPEELEGLITYVSQHPDDGETISDTGGLRVLNWPAWRDDGPKVVYLFRDLNMPVYLIALLGADESLEFTKEEKARMRATVNAIVTEQWAKQISPLIAAASKTSA